MTKEVRFGKYRIYYDPKPIPMPVHWTFVHDDYDGEGDERSGYGRDAADCIEQIKDLETFDELLARFQEEVKTVMVEVEPDHVVYYN